MIGTLRQPKSKSNFACDKRCISESLSYNAIVDLFPLFILQVYIQ